jgi:hypothetical protein
MNVYRVQELWAVMVCIHVVFVLMREEALRRMLIKLPNVVLMEEDDSTTLWLRLYSYLSSCALYQPA